MPHPHRIIWTALPQGRRDGRPWLLAYASLRLSPATQTTLAAFEAFLDWPELVAGASFGALIGDNFHALEPVFPSLVAATDPASGAALPTGTASAWWRAMFDAETPVVPHKVEDLTKAKIRTMDWLGHAKWFEQTYAAQAAITTGNRLPTMNWLYEQIFRQDIRGLSGSLRRDFRDVDEYFGESTTASVQTEAPPTAFVQTPEDAAAALDFHARLSLLGAHPILLRHLRLAVELDFPVGTALPETGAVRVVSNLGAAGGQATARPAGAPATRFDAGFRAAGRVKSGFITQGYLDGQRAGTGAIIFDVDGSVRKWQQLAGSVDGIVQAGLTAGAATAPVALPSDSGPSQPAGLPALRSSGITLAYHDQAKRILQRATDAVSLEARFAASQPTTVRSLSPAAPFDAAIVIPMEPDSGGEFPQPGAEIMLGAEDVTRGYRIDVEDTTRAPGAWKSLHRRTASYRHGDLQFEVAGDEGWVSGNLARKGIGAAAEPDYAAHPALATWNGWSLSVPLPARHVAAESGVDGKAAMLSPNSMEPKPLGLAVAMSQAQQLPSLRYGRAYRFRARAVDLAGGSVPPWAPSPAAAIGATVAAPIVALVGATAGTALALKPGFSLFPTIGSAVFHRLEPVQPVVVAFAEPIAQTGPEAGESACRLAIRSLDDEPAGDTERTARRVLLPPRVPIAMAEQHGLLDDPETGRIDRNPELWTLLRDKDVPGSATPELPVHLEYVRDPQTPALKTPYMIGETPCEASKQLVADPAAPINYIFDHLARRQTGSFEPVGVGVNEAFTLPCFDFVPLAEAKWHELGPVVVELRDGSFEIQSFVEGGVRYATISLPAGSSLRINIGARLDADDLELFGILDWAREAVGTLPPDVLTAAMTGQHWMLTPNRTLDLVHAVQRPVVGPEFRTLAAGVPAITARRETSRRAKFGFNTPVHPDSTGQLDVFASWEEPGDGGDDTVDSRSALIFSQSIGEPEFAAARNAAPADLVPGATILWTEGNYDFADTRSRQVRLAIAAVTRFREYMPPALRAEPAGLESPLVRTTPEPALCHVLSSSRPPAPRVVSVVPTFAWSEANPAPGFFGSARLGGGLRVYLDRPWFVSGFNEMLGVCTAPTSALAGSLEGFWPSSSVLTLLGGDPLVYGARPPSDMPQLLPRAVVARNQPGIVRPGYFATEWGARHAAAFDAMPERFMRFAVTMPGKPDDTMIVAPHFVDWDAERQLWFADIEIDPGLSYMPFVRLALTRYQPMSLGRTHYQNVALVDFWADQYGQGYDAKPRDEDLHASDLVYVDYVQLLPHRLALALRDPASPGQIDLRVYGVSAANSQGPSELPAALPDFEILVETVAEASDPQVERSAVAWTAKPLKRDQSLELFAQRILLESAEPRAVRVSIIESELYPSADKPAKRPVYLDVFDLPAASVIKP